MDKAYTMMWELDSRGRIAGHIFTDYSSPDAIEESFSLPVPDSNHIVNDETKAGIAGMDVTDTLVQLANILNSDDVSGVIKMRAIKEVLTELNKIDNPIANESIPEVAELVNKIKTYQVGKESAATKRNRIMYAVHYAATNLKNLKAAEVPMEAKPVTKVINAETTEGK